MTAASLALGVRFAATSSGTGDFVDFGAVTGYRAASGNLVNGKIYRYRAENASLSEWEYGYGAWTSGTNTLARTTVSLSSTGSKVAFAAAPQVAIIPFVEDILSFTDAMALTSGEQDRGRANIGVMGRNVIINGDFRINERGYVSAATLAAGAYGHDRWKAGSAGGNYSFTQLKSSTTITIAASKTLIQVIEDANVVGGNYVLSWTGTCQARTGINSATPSGAYAASPILITGQTAGTVMSVEFGNGASAGTLGTVQLEAGTVATPFEFTPLASELVKSQRYCEVVSSAFAAGYSNIAPGSPNTTSQITVEYLFKVRKRTIPAVSYSALSDFGILYNGFASVAAATSLNSIYGSSDTFTLQAGCAGAPLTIGTVAALCTMPSTPGGRLIFDAEL